MSGTPENASLWADADVYISTNLSATLPATTSDPFGVDWDLVGLLDGDDGFEEERDEDKSDYYAWGGVLVKTSRKNFKLTKKFSVLEDNDVTRSLIWPGSTATELIVPRPANILIAFETSENGKVKRLITRERAQVDVDGSIKDNESDLTKVTLAATIYPDGDGVLFDRQAVPAIVSLALTPLTLALSLAGAKIKAVVATATYDDASTGVVTSSAKWFSSNEAKATVDTGYVTGIATGTANVTATYGGVTSTAPCVATVSA